LDEKVGMGELGLPESVVITEVLDEALVVILRDDASIGANDSEETVIWEAIVDEGVGAASTGADELR
jgi:hypothetical protein